MVFKGARGKEVDYDEPTPAQFEAWGRALGEFHNLTREFKPTNRRRSYPDWLEGFESGFRRWGEEEALAELQQVKEELAKFQVTEVNFGLVHYDFQYENTFWNEEEQTFYVIDFDDAHYHFYVLDLLTALADLEEEGPENSQECSEAFYAGYKAVSPWDENVWAQRESLQRYSTLMTFYRVMYSLEDSDFESDPD